MNTMSFSFNSHPIDDILFSRIAHCSFRDAPLSMVEQLVYVQFPYFNFENKVCTAEMIVNKQIVEDVRCAFELFYRNTYAFGSIVLVDVFGGDDNESMRHNNTSCFNYRRIANSIKLSHHALALAIDINPLYNPYVKGEEVYPSESAQYADRNAVFPHKISHNDLAYDIFVHRLGWEWGGDWLHPFGYADYQHFSKIRKKS